ncbi:MAG: hypothetical protein JW915_16850 [Chitinispirillaceae bacterium]|nr:hypothetical protein [Chitinispirillaceae bacterium]
MKLFYTLFPLSVFVFFIATSTVTLTGCSEILSPGDTVRLRDTISVEKLSVPTIDSVVVLAGGKSATIHFSGSHVKDEDFTGYYRLTTKDTLTAVVADSVKLSDAKAWTGQSSFTVPISRDGVQTFWIASFNKKGKFSQPVPAFVFGRDQKPGQVFEFTVGSTNDGIDVDGTPEVKTVEDGIRADANPVKYATNTGCDIIVEEPTTAPNTLCITPIGGAVIFLANDSMIYTRAQINAIYDAGYVDTAVVQTTYGIKTFSQGRSIRDVGGLYSIKAEDYFIVITSAKNVARIKVSAVDGGTSATLVVYQDSGRNAGELLYKKTN